MSTNSKRNKNLKTSKGLLFEYTEDDIAFNKNKDRFQAKIFEGKFAEIQNKKPGANKTSAEDGFEIRVAIKYFESRERNCDRARENLEYLSQPGNMHPNFIRYFDHHHEKPNGIYLVTELCVCSVSGLFDDGRMSQKKYKKYIFDSATNKSIDIYPLDILNDLPTKEILRQSAEAVNYLHDLGLIHRNLHPGNFLIAFDARNNKYSIKLTDFQHAKDWAANPLFSGTYEWSNWTKTPECESFEDGMDSKADVFLLGCYFYYVLTKGKHPFEADDIDIKTNISDQDSPVYKEKEWNGGSAWGNNVDPENKDKLPLIQSMIRYHPEGRKTAWGVLQFLQQYEEAYNIYGDNNTNPKPGLCVIVSQETFHDPQNDASLHNDCAQLWRTFTRFGFEVIIYKNLRGDQMAHFLNPSGLESSKAGKLDQYGSLVVCILSHGGKGVVYGVDMKAVPIDGLRYQFSASGCEALKGKPKIFIILACQGNNDQIVLHPQRLARFPSREYLIKADSSSTPPDFPMMMSAGSSEDEQSSMEDFLTLISTIENFITYYTPGVGSPFIQHLCGSLMSEYRDESVKTLEDEKVKKDVVSLFHSFVVPRVGQGSFQNKKTLTVKQTPELRSTLKKIIRFRSKLPTLKITEKIKDNALNPEYDGESADPMFYKLAREYHEKLARLKVQ